MPTPKTRRPPAVAVVLVNYNGWRDSIECLDSLLATDYPDFHVFLVDNESPDDSLARLTAWCATPAGSALWRHIPGVARRSTAHAAEPLPLRTAHGADGILGPADPECRVTLIRSGANLGFAGGCNIGIRAAGPDLFDYFWLLNTDTVVHAHCLRALVERAETDPVVGMTGSTILYYDRPGTVQTLAGAELIDRNVSSSLIGQGTVYNEDTVDAAAVEPRLAYIMGASMLVSKQLVSAVGPMREDYFLYYEEIDWAMRARGEFKLAFAPRSLVYHKSGASSAKPLREFSTRLYYRNRVRFATRFFPQRLGSIKVSYLIEICRHVLRGRWLHARIIVETLLRFKTIARSEHALD
ncbi:MAG TPA: glycosyltransferase family 2 protein [Steroidobacteraceae bacterium]